MFFAYLTYWFKAQNEYAIHSPFVYQLYTQVIKPFKRYYAFAEVEALRRELWQSTQSIEVQDLGAGSRVHQSNRRNISEIARYSNARAKQGQLLFKLVAHFQPNQILELGTSLGTSTLYLAKAKPSAQVYTLEGCTQTAQIAQQNFKKLQVSNIQALIGNIDEELPKFLPTIDCLDLVFFDANHRFAPTIRYFEWCMSKAHSNSIFIFDDIHWSAEMEKAWETIKAHPKVSLTIDLFQMGLVFFQENPAKQHFILRF
ncbi:MAG: class I SAM-dependent methyltransferase [Microscillaceae bacterium]|nr:class I SAM-dependent methyltransferase [Microscillaceae bacterium]